MLDFKKCFRMIYSGVLILWNRRISLRFAAIHSDSLWTTTKFAANSQWFLCDSQWFAAIRDFFRVQYFLRLLEFLSKKSSFNKVQFLALSSHFLHTLQRIHSEFTVNLSEFAVKDEIRRNFALLTETLGYFDSADFEYDIRFPL